MSMKLLLTSIAASIISVSAFGSSYDYDRKAKTANIEPVKVNTHNNMETITLTDKNSIIFAGEVNTETVSKAIMDLSRIKSNDVYIHINSPGGSVFDGIKLASALMASNKHIICIADFAASMAFVTLQMCDERVVVRNSIVMQHEASFGIRNESAPNVESFFNFIKSTITDMEEAQAKRIGISVKEFKAKIRSDWWLFGEASVKANVADRMVEVECTKALMDGTREQRYSTVFGVFIVTWSTCPLIEVPLSVAVGGEYVSQDNLLKFTNSLNYKSNFINSISSIKQ